MAGPDVGDFGRPVPAGFPAERPAPPVIAEPDDPFTTLRVLEAVARMERGRAVPIAALVAHLDATHLDWLFPRDAVVSVLVALQANWMADYRNASGIVLDEGAGGATIALEDSSRVDPWLVRQALREAARCRDLLAEFARRDRIATGG
jgi:hypothetical protein